MKKLFFLSIFLISTSVLFAQKTVSFDDFSSSESIPDENEVQTVMNSFELKRISGFGGPTVSYTTINGEFAVMSGGGGGVIINDLFIGGYGEGVSNYINNNSTSAYRDIEFGHGGFWLGYEFYPEKMIHPVFSTRLGWGGISGVDSDNHRLKDNVYVVVPTISAEINFTRFFKVNIGAEYRQTFNVDLGDLKSKDFSNVGLYMNFIFGWF